MDNPPNPTPTPQLWLSILHCGRCAAKAFKNRKCISTSRHTVRSVFSIGCTYWSELDNINHIMQLYEIVQSRMDSWKCTINICHVPRHLQIWICWEGEKRCKLRFFLFFVVFIDLSLTLPDSSEIEDSCWLKPKQTPPPSDYHSLNFLCQN